MSSKQTFYEMVHAISDNVGGPPEIIKSSAVPASDPVQQGKMKICFRKFPGYVNVLIELWGDFVVSVRNMEMIQPLTLYWLRACFNRRVMFLLRRSGERTTIPSPMPSISFSSSKLSCTFSSMVTPSASFSTTFWVL